MNPKRGDPVPRPSRRTEYELLFITQEAVKGWRDCVAGTRNAIADAYDRLSTQPLTETPRQYWLRADYATGTYQGRSYDRWQYKISNGGRLWYFVDETASTRAAGRVLIERADPGHPRETE